MKARWIFAASILLIAAAPPSDSGRTEDVRCFIALSALSQTADGETKQAAAAGTLYFLGRLDGHSPGLDLEAAVTAEAPGMTEAVLGSLLKSCGEKIRSRGEYLLAVGGALQKKGK